MEDIHHFRVEIKKLTMLLHALSSSQNHSNKMKLPKKMNKFYTTIGAIRNIRLQQNRIIELVNNSGEAKPSTYLGLLNNEAIKKIQKTKIICRSMNDLTKQETKFENTFKKKPKTVSIKRFLLGELKMLSKQMPLSNTMSDKKFHSIRKIFKDILYAMPYINKKGQTYLPDWMSNQTKLNSLTNLLGDFQDTCTGLKFLRSYYLKKVTRNERILLLNIKKGWKNKKKEIKNRFCSQLKNPSYSTLLKNRLKTAVSLN